MGEETKRTKRIADIYDQIRLDELVSFKNHPFQTYEGDRLQKLADSIRSIALQEPIVVRPHPKGEGKYEILSGHNRVEAVRLLGWEKIDAIIKNSLSNREAEQIVLDSNLNQQSFNDWKYSQQIKVIRMYDRYIKDNSRQGKRSDREGSTEAPSGATSVGIGQKSAGKPKRPTTRDRVALQLGIPATKFEMYRSIAKLDDGTVKALCEMLDSKRLGFNAAYRLSQLKSGERGTVLSYMADNAEYKLNGKKAYSLYRDSKGSVDAELTGEAIREVLLSDDAAL